MDIVWDEYRCDNKNLNWENISAFYSHPVWLLNGLFIEQHDVSMGYRHSISKWIIKQNFESVVDFGSGFGTLARLIAEKDKEITIDIYEPYPSKFGLKRAAEFENIQFINKIESKYDCLVATDVLKHVPDPLRKLDEMIKAVRLGGYLIIANCFYPVIKCHLPQTFHLRYTFNQFARIMGLQVVGSLVGSHATIYKKVEEKAQNWKKIRFYEKLSKIAFPIIEFLKPVLRPIKRVFIK